MDKIINMKKAACIILLIFTGSFAKAQPYSITAYIDSSVITSNEISSLQSVSYAGQAMNWVFDRRVDDWIFLNTYLFDVIYDDGITSQVQVNPEFDITAATIEAEKYAFILGQLPACLRTGIDKIWIHLGTESFGGGFDAVLIHVGQSASYEQLGILEEVLVHEAVHTALDPTHAAASGWLAAQNSDGGFISTYAASSPTVEDLAESFLTWIMVRQCDLRISTVDSLMISESIPQRLEYLDSQNFSMYPLCIDSGTMGVNEKAIQADVFLFPNPTNGQFSIQSTISLTGTAYFICNETGQLIENGQISCENMNIDLNHLPNGVYLFYLENGIGKPVKVIKG